MVKLTYAAADPEAMVVELSHALVAVMAVLAAVRLLEVADQAESLGWQHHGG